MNDFSIDTWIGELADRLTAAFGDRLVFVGIQGSWARGEARASSDIDAVVVIDGLASEDIELYREVVSGMPRSELACGFLGSPEVLAGWPRHDVFNLINDTASVYGSLDFLDTEFTDKDSILSAKVGASEIYHTLCHTMAFEPQALDGVLQACAKNAFSIMRALVFAQTGEYPSSRARMFELANEDEKALLLAYEDPQSIDHEILAKTLLKWPSEIIAEH